MNSISDEDISYRTEGFSGDAIPAQQPPMNGAESLVRTLVDNEVDVCFANPGTSEMHFVGAPDRVPGVRPILGLFEGVVTGAAQPHEDGPSALEALAERLGASPPPIVAPYRIPDAPEDDDALANEAIMRIVGRVMPDHAIISEESVSSGFPRCFQDHVTVVEENS
jgi:hypothetical protein